MQRTEFALFSAAMCTPADQQRSGQNQLFDELRRTDHARALSTTSLSLSTTSPCSLSMLADTSQNPKRRSTPPSTSFTTPSHTLSANFGCPASCGCCCHRLRPITPQLLSPWVGEIYLPGNLLLFFFAATFCDDTSCGRKRETLITIKWRLPRWFAEIDAKIRLRAFPIYFYLQTPRIVEDLHILHAASLSDVQQMLWTRKLTLSDVGRDGTTIIHVSPTYHEYAL